MPRLIALLIGATLLSIEAQLLLAQGQFPDRTTPVQLAPSAEPAPVAKRKWFSLPKMPWSKKDKAEKSIGSSGNDAGKSHTDVDDKLGSQAAFARLNERRGQQDLAEAIYRELIRKEPGMSLPNHRLGVMEAKKGNFEAANSHFQVALSGDPDNEELLTDAGYCLYLQNRMEEAEQLYQRAFQINPDNQSLCNNLGLLLGEQKRFDEALILFKRGGSSAAAHANLAFVMAQLGELELAERNFHAALEQDPKLRSAAVGLLQLDSHKRNQTIEANLAQNALTGVGPSHPSAPATEQVDADPTMSTTWPGGEQQTDLVLPGMPSERIATATFHHEEPTLPEARTIVADDTPATASVTAADFWDGHQKSVATTVADVVVGGQKVVGDLNDQYPVRYTGNARVPNTAAAVAESVTASRDIGPPALDAVTDQRASRSGARQPVVRDIQLPQPQEGSSKQGREPNAVDPTVLPAAGTFAPTIPEMPQATGPGPIAPVMGSHYNLNPHSQMWASPNPGQGNWGQGEHAYPTTPYGSSPPPQKLPSATHAGSIYRR